VDGRVQSFAIYAEKRLKRTCACICPRQPVSFTLRFGTENVDELHVKVQGGGVAIVTEPTTYAWGNRSSADQGSRGNSLPSPAGLSRAGFYGKGSAMRVDELDGAGRPPSRAPGGVSVRAPCPIGAAIQDEAGNVGARAEETRIYDAQPAQGVCRATGWRDARSTPYLPLMSGSIPHIRS
jgi:hypothetical protein